jgi:alpha-tubulin suppressor-like RCC1 family protein
LGSKNIVEFKNSIHHMVAKTVDGNIYSWSANRFGYLGNGKEQDGNICKPELIVKTSHENLENNVKEICCGYHHTLALTNEGDVFACGWNKLRQIGNEIWYKFRRDNKDAIIPTKIKGFECDKVKAIACGAKFSLALILNDRVFLWSHVSDDVEIRLTPEQKQGCNKPKEIIIERIYLLNKLWSRTLFIIVD